MAATGQSDNAVTFTFDKPSGPPDMTAITAAVEAEAGGKLVDPPSPAAVEIAAATIPPAAADPADPPAPVAPPATADDLKTYKITVDGVDLEVTEADLKSGHMRHRDYTQKTQALATERARVQAQEQSYAARDAEYQRQLTAIDSFLRDQAAVDAYRQRAFGSSAIPVPQIDPSRPLNIQDVADIARYNAEQVRLAAAQDLDTRLAEQRAEVESSRRAVQVEKLEGAIDTHIDALLEQYPILKKLGDRDDVSEELIGMAAKFNPTSLDEARLRLKEAAERKVANIRSIAADEKKSSAIDAARLARQSPEPPGGKAAPTAPTKKITLDHKDRASRIEAGIADMQAYLNANT